MGAKGRLKDVVVRHCVRHSYRDEMIVPFCAITKNIDLFLKHGKHLLLCSDNTIAQIVESKEVHICELEKDIERLYGLTAWDFIKRWWANDKHVENLYFVKLKLKRVEQ